MTSARLEDSSSELDPGDRGLPPSLQFLPDLPSVRLRQLLERSGRSLPNLRAEGPTVRRPWPAPSRIGTQSDAGVGPGVLNFTETTNGSVPALTNHRYQGGRPVC